MEGEFYREFEDDDRGNGWKPLADQIDELQRIWIAHTDSHDVNKVKECLENAVKVTGVDITQPKTPGPFKYRCNRGIKQTQKRIEWVCCIGENVQERQKKRRKIVSV
ncbi:hypothetical protein XENORESO_017077 [Xenotaenia resolanae]|uniref:Uncharacterized protein n=1 Tax=Xenotaenia resolanae TaxID=208358 RepID=A0ABV0W9W3_9TELE